MTVDSLGFLDALGGLPEQLAHAHEIAGEVHADQFPRGDVIRNVVVLGMGGSGIAGDVVAAAFNDELPVPITVLKQIRTPAFVGPETLAIAVSYSGDTEETVSMASSAVERDAQLVAISCGGRLAEVARDAGALHLPCPEGFMPRAAIGALVAPLLVTLFRTGLAPGAHANLVTAQVQLAHRRDRCVPSVVGAANPARELARRIGRTIPMIYGGGALGGAAAYRWKCDMNENAKSPAFWNQYPELDHNEICGWGQHGDVTRQLISLVELRHGFEHKRLRPRFDVTREIIGECVHQVLEVQAEGDGRLAQLLDLMYVGDWTSCYLALLNDVDPGPIDAIFELKARLAEAD
ncbi:MAG: glucose/mannose-6-phosphate isomerase [Actinomycetota bacterium]|nr:glucose/mannose-6-phosphate isomerase [Actinomycetota bacterium]MDQ1477420.1 glucose/mannose-6-phosphate isomerase [Actinomycetota bacterium]